MTRQLCEAIRVNIRYDTKDENGETRRERNTRFNHPTPNVRVPPEGRYLWDWFLELNQTRQEGKAGPQRLTHSEIKAWAELRRVVIRPEEVAVLMEMDNVFISETRQEINDALTRITDKARQGGR